MRCASSWKSRTSSQSLAVLTNSSSSVRKRLTRAARRPICVATDRSLSSTPPWQKRSRASASSNKGVSSRSRAFFRKDERSSLIQLWILRRTVVLGEPFGGDAEDLLGHLGARCPVGARFGPVVVPRVLAVSVGRRLSQESARLLHSAPVQVVDHLPPEPAQQSAGRSGAENRG